MSRIRRLPTVLAAICAAAAFHPDASADATVRSNAPTQVQDEQTTTDAVAAEGEAEPAGGDAEPAGEGWTRFTGEWWGWRPQLEEHGVTIDFGYSLDFSLNTRGGLNTHNSDTYLGLFDLSVTLNTEALGLWPGGTLYLDFQDFRGESITDRHVGDLFILNANDAPSRSQFSEYWYEQSLFDGGLRVRVGKQDANADFATTEFAGSFVSSAPYMVANIPMPTYPDPALGVAVFIEPVEWLMISAGIYDNEGLGTTSGFKTAFHSPDDSFSIAEIALRPVWTLDGVELPGTYRVGGWYHSGDWDVYRNDLGGRVPTRTHRSSSGIYCTFDQLLYRENPEIEEDEQGLGVFFQFGWAPSPYNEITQVYGTGLQYAYPSGEAHVDR